MIAALALFAAPAFAGPVTYTCDPTVDATDPGTCLYLNTTLSELYGSTFSNANASIYIKQGVTGLGSSITAESYLPFGDYVSALTSEISGNAVQTGALAALNSLDTAVYGADNVVVTSALASALGFTEVGGLTSAGANCILGVDSGCYDGIITITTPANLYSETGQSLYYRQNGGTIGANAYDYYSVVQHETNEILGTVSCIDTTSGGILTDSCDSETGAAAGTGTPSAADLFRYNSAGSLAANNAYLGLAGAPSGAYFSYNGGVTNGAAGAVYNTIANGSDYADFTNTCTFVQDATGCTGKIFNITTDGNATINTLEAVGYNAAPEPGTLILAGAGLVCVLALGRQAAVRNRGLTHG